MKAYDVLLKSVTLLYREFLLGEDDRSNDLVINTLRSMKTPKNNRHPILGGDSDAVKNLKEYIEDLALQDGDDLDLESILQSIKLTLTDSPEVYKAFEESLTTEVPQNGLKTSILSMRRYLNNYHRRMQIKAILNKASFEFNNDAYVGNKETNKFLTDLVTELETLELTTRFKDPAVVNEVDIGDDAGLADIADEVVDEANSTTVLSTGWQGLNKMLQGGPRRGEQWAISALQHSYKSGLVTTLFLQLAVYNKPTLKDPTKKPLMVFFSLEDPLKNTISFAYRYFYYQEHGKLPDMNEVTAQEMGAYIKGKLSANGFHVKFSRIDPSEWSYKSLFSWIMALEAEGYEIITCFVDYLDMVPKTGCINNGTSGSDIQDLFRRTRNFMAARNILFVTPHQMSTEAKALKRSGLNGPSLLRETANKGYYKGSRSLDQEFDGELQLDRFKMDGKWYLAIMRGKHRLPTMVDEDNLLICLPFPHKAPIMPDVGMKDSAFYPDKTSSEDSFDF